MRVMITGSRLWTNREVIQKELDKLPRDCIIVHGGARGADTLAGNVAASLGLSVEVHIPDWRKNGRAAGILRNNVMLDSDIDLVLAFRVNDSKGTTHAINGARTRDIPYILNEDNYR